MKSPKLNTHTLKIKNALTHKFTKIYLLLYSKTLLKLLILKVSHSCVVSCQLLPARKPKYKIPLKTPFHPLTFKLVINIEKIETRIFFIVLIIVWLPKISPNPYLNSTPSKTFLHLKLTIANMLNSNIYLNYRFSQDVYKINPHLLSSQINTFIHDDKLKKIFWYYYTHINFKNFSNTIYSPPNNWPCCTLPSLFLYIYLYVMDWILFKLKIWTDLSMLKKIRPKPILVLNSTSLKTLIKSSQIRLIRYKTHILICTNVPLINSNKLIININQYLKPLSKIYRAPLLICPISSNRNQSINILGYSIKKIECVFSPASCSLNSTLSCNYYIKLAPSSPSLKNIILKNNISCLKHPQYSRAPLQFYPLNKNDLIVTLRKFYNSLYSHYKVSPNHKSLIKITRTSLQLALSILIKRKYKKKL